MTGGVAQGEGRGLRLNGRSRAGRRRCVDGAGGGANGTVLHAQGGVEVLGRDKKGKGMRGRGQETAPRPGRPPPVCDPLSRDAAGHGTDGCGQAAGSERPAAITGRLAGAATVPVMFAAATTSQGAALLVTSAFARLLRRR